MKITQGIIIEVDQDFAAAAEAQALQNIKDAIERHHRRMVKYKEWVDPEAMKQRKEEFDLAAAAAFELGKLMGRNLELLPIPDPLPDYMKGQSASTIQAMLRHEQKK